MTFFLATSLKNAYMYFKHNYFLVMCKGRPQVGKYLFLVSWNSREMALDNNKIADTIPMNEEQKKIGKTNIFLSSLLVKNYWLIENIEINVYVLCYMQLGRSAIINSQNKIIPTLKQG